DWIAVQPAQYRASPIFARRLTEQGTPIGYIHIRRFTVDVAGRLQEVVKKLESQNISAWVFDLRGDGGGETDEIVRCADLFLDQGPLLRRRGSGKRNIPGDFRVDDVLVARVAGEITRKPIVILVDARTASSAEMFAGILAESLRAVLVGWEGGTFGKWT